MRDEHARQKERWSSGSAYESYVGRWSRQVAPEFIAWLDVSSNVRWLDVGCGTAALTQAIIDHAEPASAVGADRSIAFVEFTQNRTVGPIAAFVAGDATALPFADDTFDAAVSGLVLNFVPEPTRMISEMARVTREGGCVAVYVWDYGGEMQMMRHFWDAATELDPAAREFDEGARFTVANQDRLGALFREAGLTGVETRAIDIATSFREFDDYWSPFLGGTGTAPGYVASLGEARRTALRERLRARLPVRPDGSIQLMARANAVRGIR